jgi:amino acid transporter
MQASGAHVLITLSIAVMAGLNIFSAKLVGETEDYVVGAKVLILVAFVVVALFATDLGASAPSNWAGPGSLIAGGMLIFVAYEGFELIANSAADVRDPGKTLPRAFYGSVIFTIALYMLVAIAIVGLLSLTEIAGAADFALAEAAQEIWGSIGFNLIVLAALLSTASAINATLYGTSRLSVKIASEGELPDVLERKIGGKPLIGMLGTAVVAALMANLIPLASISSLASVGFLIVFAAVNAANARLNERTGSRRWMSVSGAVACLGALFALIVHIAQTRPQDLILLTALLSATFVGEAAYRRFR